MESPSISHSPPHSPKPITDQDFVWSGLPSTTRRMSVSIERALLGAQIGADYCTIFLCYLAGFWIYTNLLQRQSPQHLGLYTQMVGVISFLYVLLLGRFGLYRRQTSLLNIKEIRGIFSTSLLGAALILSAAFYVRSETFSRIIFSIAMVLSPLALLIERHFFYRFQKALHQKGWVRERVLVYGAGKIGNQLVRGLLDSPLLGFSPIGFLDDDVHQHGQTKALKVLGGMEQIKVAKKNHIDRIFIALPKASSERVAQIVSACTSHGLAYSLVPMSYESYSQFNDVLEIGGISVLQRAQVRYPWFYLTLKRVFDVFFSTVLLIVGFPILVMIALAIKLDSPGPVIFKQKRVGLKGREFSFYKFRTLVRDSPKYMNSPKSVHDSRITHVGRWLRRTSFDELPQLFNVLRGDMSVVGPRPEMPFIVSQYDPLQKLRLEMKPGMTGIWQISADRGAPIHQNMEYDLFYLKNRSLLLDFAIIAKTFYSVIKGIGAV